MGKTNFLQSSDFILTTSAVDLAVSRPLPSVMSYKPYSYVIVAYATVTKGETKIDVNSLPLSLPTNFELDFNGKIVITSQKNNIGDRYITVYPVNIQIEKGDLTIVSPLFSVYSVNQVENTLNPSEIESKVFHSKTWVSKRNTSQSMDIQCSGVMVRNDTGLYFIERANFLYDKVWFKLDDSQDIFEGFAYIKDYVKTRITDKHIEVSFSLLIDGPVFSEQNTLIAELLQDENTYYLLDDNNYVVLQI